MSVASVKAELLKPVTIPGQAVQQSPDAFITSVRTHHVGLLCQQVTRFSALAENWDGYGAVAPSAAAVGNVIDLINRLPYAWTSSLSIDGLTPTPYGTVTLEWTRGDDYLSVEVGDEDWSFIAEVKGHPQLAMAETYPNPELLTRVTSLLCELFPADDTSNGSIYTA
ncbi:hypothetical protein MON38_10710 [Hymenobacter sp. DH14]|uniref:Uncharacterized protein n=1 Tax=Hymenobacter cyanobacteriorum TaxID=2926463 RepID=A0A9X1VGR2_9BACT|nr:hypothetical protein [Hymenobacter cyanobacteriorum]MCI1187892.1 hypothetical protein [Hymenobacter cyanobacteriorum]